MPLVSADLAPETSISTLAIERIGLREYESALALQREIHRNVAGRTSPNTLLLLEHPSIYTAGKRTLDSEKPVDGTQVVNVDRGGKITWHGPGQLVGYPIVRLANPHELVGFVREIETGLINVCAEFSMSATRIAGRSGVWIIDGLGERKIAAIGIRVASSVTMHGFALNVNPDLSYFQKIIPCGINDAQVTSLAQELGRDINVEEVLPVVERHLTNSLNKVSA